MLTNVKSRYFIFGVWNWLFGVIVFLLLSYFLKTTFHYNLLVFLSYIRSSTQAHFIQRKFVWFSTNYYPVELLKFIFSYIGMFISNIILITASVSITNLSPTILQLIISPVLVIFMYVVNKTFVFRFRI
jgi:hypothetical protein